MKRDKIKERKKERKKRGNKKETTWEKEIKE